MEFRNTGFWKDRNVFVTGATGLLGSALVEELLHRGANIVTLVRDWIPDSKLVTTGLLSHTRVVRGDVEDLLVLMRTLNEYEIDTVFHLGAQAVVGAASRSPLSTFETNIRGTWNVLEACRLTPRLVKRVVVASSDKAYGIHDQLPYKEEARLQGLFPYDVSKSCADLISLSYFATYHTPVCVTRCGNLFGGGDLNFNRLVPGTIRSILRNERPVIRSDGSFVRDYFFVADAADAYLQLAEHMLEVGVVGEAFNFGADRPLSVLELVGMLLQLTHRTDLQPVVLNEATHEIPRQYLDCSKARTRLRWLPRHSLEEALLKTIDWYDDWLARADGQVLPFERIGAPVVQLAAPVLPHDVLPHAVHHGT